MNFVPFKKLFFKWLYVSFHVARVFRKIRLPLFFQKKFNCFRQSQITKYLEKQQSRIIKYYAGVQTTIKEKIPNEKIIWIFWWQGKDNMPDIVNCCINSIIKNNKSARIVFVDKNNIRKYTCLPDYIYAKIGACISLTQLSDIVRWNLLSIHGGLWVDATIFCTAAFPDRYFNNDYFTLGPYSDPESFYVSRGRWTSFFWGSKPNSIFSKYMNAMLLNYWSRESKLIDYFLIDFIIDIGVSNNIGQSGVLNRRLKVENPQLPDLVFKLNQKHHSSEITNLFRDTNVFKLTYKQHFSKDFDSLYCSIIRTYKNLYLITR